MDQGYEHRQGHELSRELSEVVLKDELQASLSGRHPHLDVLQAVKRNLRPDWTQPHRSDVRAAVRYSVKMVLKRRRLRDDDREAFAERLLAQAEARFGNWPLAA